jgi:asparagine synthase (glutamine-hydrolysing)
MSGFVAVWNEDGSPVDLHLLVRMVEFLRSRGPHADGIHVAAGAALGFAALDVTGQPHHDRAPFTLDRQRWIVGDGRIDGRRDLLAQLAAGDCAPLAADVTDLELMLRAYLRWGDECTTHLLGDFAFAVLDETDRRLFCARDQLGIKPLFHARVGRTVLVSNTLDCLRCDPRLSTVLNETAVADFLMFGGNQELDTTIFRDIARLPPAHSVSWSRRGCRQRRYWTLPIDEPIAFRRPDDYIDRFGELLRDAVDDRIAGRRVGVLMSGGVDSTTIAATAAALARERGSGPTVEAITSVYDRLIPDDERRYASMAAEWLDIPIRFDVRDDETSIGDWDRVDVRTPEPVASPPAFAAAVEMLRQVAQSTPVLLYGEGPDNALLYEWRPYLSHLIATRAFATLVRAGFADLWWHPRPIFWSSIRQRLSTRADAERWRAELPAWLEPEFARTCCQERWDAWQREPRSPHPIRPKGYASFATPHWQSLFDDCDITGACGQVEFRHPFLDLRLLRYLLAVPAIPWCRNKLLVRRSMRGALPRAILARKKTPVPVSPDFERVRSGGWPALAPSPELRRFVNPDKIPDAPRNEVEMRAALRPLGLGHWLDRLNSVGGENSSHDIRFVAQGA